MTRKKTRATSTAKQAVTVKRADKKLGANTNNNPKDDTQQELPGQETGTEIGQTAQILIGFPNHLFKLENWQNADISKIPTHFILYEHPLFYGHRMTPGKLMYNKIRLVYVRATILAYLDYLKTHVSAQKSDTNKLGTKKSGLVSVSFISVDDCLGNPQALASQITKLQKDHKLAVAGAKSGVPAKSIVPVKYWDPVDIELSNDQMQKLSGQPSENPLSKLDSPLFATTEASLAEYHTKHNTGRFTHSAFYNWQKTRPEMKEFKFPGHSYDTENRGQMPLSTAIPPLPKLIASDNKYLADAEKYISAHREWGAKTRPGSANTINNIVFPVSHAATHDWFQNFLTTKLEKFGKYQDSIDGQARNYLFHSCISPMMNLGLITPMEVIIAAHKYYAAHASTVGVANYEGFIRQVIGWREYQRYIYLYAGQKMRQSNHFGNKARLTPKWYTGELGVQPVDDAIKMAFRDGYLHHILRLMVMGNFMNLAGLHPDEVYRWFMEFAMDSYDWVMVGNVYSMALWADGGLSMRKPYISSDSYIMTLGTYVKETTRSKSFESDKTSSSDTSSSESSSSSSSRSTHKIQPQTQNSNLTTKSMGWNRIWYVLFYYFINRCQTQLKSTYYAGLVKAWNNKSETDKTEIIKDAKLIISGITK